MNGIVGSLGKSCLHIDGHITVIVIIPQCVLFYDIEKSRVKMRFRLYENSMLEILERYTFYTGKSDLCDIDNGFTDIDKMYSVTCRLDPELNIGTLAGRVDKFYGIIGICNGERASLLGFYKLPDPFRFYIGRKLQRNTGYYHAVVTTDSVIGVRRICRQDTRYDEQESRRMVQPLFYSAINY